MQEDLATTKVQIAIDDNMRLTFQKGVISEASRFNKRKDLYHSIIKEQEKLMLTNEKSKTSIEKL